MAKRFIDTMIWTQNKWFRKLKPELKLFWFYLLSNCDNVGVWEEDLELVSFIIGYNYNKNEIQESLGTRIKIFNNKKWWVVDFCDFQYGKLKNDITNKPHQSYITLLKKHSLWIDYQKTIDSLKDKDKDKDKEKNKDKDKDKSAESNYKPIKDCSFWNDSDFKNAWQSWQTVRTKKKCSNSDRAIKMVVKKLMQLSDGKKEKAIQIIDNSANGGWTDIYELKVEHGKSDKAFNKKEKAMNDFETQKSAYPNYSNDDIINGLNVSEETKVELKVLYKDMK